MFIRIYAVMLAGLFFSTFASASSGLYLDCEEMIKANCSSLCLTSDTSMSADDGVDYKTYVVTTVVALGLGAGVEKTFGLIGKGLKAAYRGITGCCRNNLSDCFGRLYRKHHTLDDLLPTDLLEGYKTNLRSFDQLLLSPEYNTDRRFLTFEDGGNKLAGYHYNLLDYYQVRIYKTGVGSDYQIVGALSADKADHVVEADALQAPPNLRNVWEIIPDEERGLETHFFDDVSAPLSQVKLERFNAFTQLWKEKHRQNSRANKVRFLLKQAFVSEEPIPAGKEDAVQSLRSSLLNKLLTHKRNYPATRVKVDLLSSKHRIYLLLPIEREASAPNSFMTIEILVP